jgi:hypothetical protein
MKAWKRESLIEFDVVREGGLGVDWQGAKA